VDNPNIVSEQELETEVTKAGDLFEQWANDNAVTPISHKNED